MKKVLQNIKQLWPNSLFSRLMVAWLVALLAGHLISVMSLYFKAGQYDVERTRTDLARDLAIFLPILENAQPDQRQIWLKKMDRSAYSFELSSEPGSVGVPTFPGSGKSIEARDLIQEIHSEIGNQYDLVARPVALPSEKMALRLNLSDGTALNIHIRKSEVNLSILGGVVFALQMLAVAAITWFTVRQATQPLVRLVDAAEVLGQSLQCEPLKESGPTEVVRAAAAFNAMRRRITDHLAERVHILAAISHDLQTPITRMRLRIDLMDGTTLRDKLQGDLSAMQRLVAEGIAYARSPESAKELPCRVDIDAMLDSLVCDYVDGGHKIELTGEIGYAVVTRPHTLRRIVINLVDNALKFADQVEINVTNASEGVLSISILDRGPGIAANELNAVVQPFYRVESSRNRDTGGTGLGLAIAQQLAVNLKATLSLANREGGGLEAKIVFPTTA